MKPMRGVLRVSFGFILALIVGCGGAERGESDLGDERVGSTGEELGLSYRIEYISAPEGVESVGPEDVNNRGQVVGGSASATTGDAFIWSSSAGFATLARLAGAESMRAVAVNEHGVVAGVADVVGGQRPVIWSASGEVTNLGVYGQYVYQSPDSSWSVESAIATDINDRGHVVGETSSPEFPGVAYLWDARSGMRLLGTLGGEYSTAWAVNSLDEVVGSSYRSDGITHAFLWSRGQMLDLDALSGSYSEAYAINDLGVVSGIYQNPAGEIRVFRWTRARGMVDVGQNSGEPEVVASFSTGINVFGQIVGGVRRSEESVRAAVRHPWGRAWQELMPGSPYGSFATAVNDRGVIVGRVDATLGFDPPSRGVIWYPRISL
jgi:probable HAF family extracellular repeat protein